MRTQDEPTLAEQRERLDELRRREGSLGALRARQHALEIECIACDVALRRGAGGHVALDAAAAVEMEAALERRDDLEQRLARSHEGTREEGGRLAAAREALRLWLEAPRSEKDRPAAGRAKHVLFAASLLAIIAALSVHLVFLVLLLPIAGASSFLSRSGQDRAWRQMGAKRRFEAARLPAPERWEEVPVRRRLDEIEALIAARAARDKSRVDDTPRTLRAMLDAEHEALAASLARAGLDAADLDHDTEGRIRELGRASRARRELAEVQAEIAGISRDLDALREDLYRYLARRGAAGAAGRADTATLAAGLARLAPGATGSAPACERRTPPAGGGPPPRRG